MNKVFRFLLICASSCLIAAPVGNTSAPSLLDEGIWIPDTSWYNFRIGFCSDRVSTQLYHSSKHQGIREASLKQFAYLISATWNIRERFDLQGLLGWGAVHWKWKQNGLPIHGNARHGLYWMANAKLVLLQIKKSALGMDIKTGGWTSMSGHYRADDGSIGSSHFSTFFGQIATAFTQQIHWFYPYVGVVVLQENLKASKVLGHTIRLQTRKRSGPFGGVTFSNGSYFFLNVEGRGVIETAYSISCEIRF